ncbi:MAG TPA: hypothetical protein VGE92_16450 [Steroidobacteraceae bacterium]
MSNRRFITPLPGCSDAGRGAGPCACMPHDSSERERMSRLARTIESEIVPRLLISSTVSQRSGLLAEDAAQLTRLLAALTQLQTALLKVSAAAQDSKT